MGGRQTNADRLCEAVKELTLRRGHREARVAVAAGSVRQPRRAQAGEAEASQRTRGGRQEAAAEVTLDDAIATLYAREINRGGAGTTMMGAGAPRNGANVRALRRTGGVRGAIVRHANDRRRALGHPPQGRYRNPRWRRPGWSSAQVHALQPPVTTRDDNCLSSQQRGIRVGL
jgi:hypothetical protein